ncbi:2-amino-4-hydroxy-6-hydroxymethyldihydropteridine diphosphokinase [Romboutsia ilealis]|uniref:2-amino-4-hydroxy-6-hydroxymethyldihydropteridine diphosphokinase n=1 Tax=Romboutsia faecis TaxID=2764597 RepID=A0ABR7JS67_9FIRM|nr:2-amino-4-hydroxy-6-hydroxymethyldihydropteridine diphosphokinase [Romboutsia faecis]MBC5997715.1 2-amino-4-hydroxy-6-hydroxymethyldihydropteridine diphosphokinase [Romboutsia faecis]MRN25337.1 2-amino-4-hydroxy-6-hydroxymethyldihydropteridine diphosphokinase [Romboutsia ilealis]
MNKSYLGLGTNMGDRVKYLSDACELLNNHEKINITKKSKIYETKAWGYTEQADFLNVCLEVDTSLNEYELLSVCQEVEQKLDRKRIIRWGPRTIDVDILFFNNIVSSDENLLIPHPRIKERAFVLIPLIDLNSKLSIDGKTIDVHLNSLTKEERDEVKEFTGDEKDTI